MPIKDKTLYILLVILALLGIMGVILPIIFAPPSNQYRTYVISGKINPSEQIVGNKPQYVSVYYPNSMPQYLCRSSIVKSSAIEWVDGTNGEYQVLFTVPIGLNDILLTTDCTSCDNKKVRLNAIPNSIDLTWGAQKCNVSFQIDTEQPKAVEHAGNFLNYIDVELVDKNFNSSDVQSIKQDIKQGKDAILESDRMKTSNSNESLLHAYYAEWFARRARYKMRLFELKNCIGETNALIKYRENDKCFIPDHEAHTDYSDANVSYSYSKDSRLLTEYPFDIQDVDKMKQELVYVDNQEQTVYDLLRKCEDSFEIITGTFEYQRPYCEARAFNFHVTYLIWIVVCIYIGILIEKGTQRWKK